ncbi:hypothetical protein RZS08_30655, partial [Arthrospira platensis SPKY1]|nr:hypothetical protein [Arthrospira platensis SPKY1]
GVCSAHACTVSGCSEEEEAPSGCAGEPCNPFESCGCSICAWQLPLAAEPLLAVSLAVPGSSFSFRCPALALLPADHWQPPKKD